MLAELNHIASMAAAPFSERPVEAGNNRERRSRRHNPLGILPATDQMVVLGHKFSGFPDPKRLTHTPPAFDSQFGKSISRPQSLTHCERILTSIKLTARTIPAAQGLETHCPCSRLQPTSPVRPDTP